MNFFSHRLVVLEFFRRVMLLRECFSFKKQNRPEQVRYVCKLMLLKFLSPEDESLNILVVNLNFKKYMLKY